MDRIEALKAFVLVAEEGGFSRAAAELGISKSAASRKISTLERGLGAALFTRTTRRVDLTEAGQTYLSKVRAVLADFEAADRSVGAPQVGLDGPIRLAAPIAFGTSRLAGIVAALMARHPLLIVDVVLADRFVEADEEGFDLVLDLEADASANSALRLLPLETGLFASPDYIARHGRPQAPADLAGHQALCLGARSRRIAWQLRGQAEPIELSPRLVSNHASVIREAALAGLGIAFLPAFVVTEDVRAGRLHRLLDGFEPKPNWLCARHPGNRTVSAKCRLFTDFLVERMRRDG